MPTFKTKTYEFGRGKRPYGWAAWRFRDADRPERRATSPCMGYGAAKRWARDALPGARVIEVMP